MAPDLVEVVPVAGDDDYALARRAARQQAVQGDLMPDLCGEPQLLASRLQLALLGERERN